MSLKTTYGNILAVLALFTQILTNSIFDGITIICELIFLSVLFYRYCLIPYRPWQLLVLIFCLIILSFGIVTAGLTEFMISFKIMVPVFLIYFLRNDLKFNKTFFDIVFLINFFLVGLQLLQGEFIFPSIPSTFGDHTSAQPLGLFLSYTYNASFFCIYTLLRFNIFYNILLVPLVYVMGVYTATVSFIFGILGNKLQMGNFYLFMGFFICLVSLPYFLSYTIIDIYILVFSAFDKLESFGVMLGQYIMLYEWMTITSYIIPQEYGVAAVVPTTEFATSDHIEIQFFSNFIRYGFATFFMYIISLKLFKNASLFIIISLIHVGYVFSPFLLLMAVSFTYKEIKPMVIPLKDA